MVKKLIILAITVGSLGIINNSLSMELSAPAQEAITWGFTSYWIGVTPVFWPLVPFVLNGSFAPSGSQSVASRVGMVTGLAAGATTVGLAAYGVDQLLCKHSESYKQTKEAILHTTNSFLPQINIWS